MKRFIAGLLLAASVSAPAVAGERTAIPEKSEIAFTVTQMGVGVSGQFSRFSARVNLDPAKLETASAELEVDIASISTGEPEADKEAVATPWLDAAGFPKATFTSSSIRALGADRYELKGMLSIKGQPRELSFPVTFKARPDGSAEAIGEFTVRRTDFGVGGGEWNEGDLVANEVPVRFRIALTAPR